MDTHCDADAMSELSRPTMTNAILYTDSYINIAISILTFPSAHFLLFNCVLSIYNKRIPGMLWCIRNRIAEYYDTPNSKAEVYAASGRGDVYCLLYRSDVKIK